MDDEVLFIERQKFTQWWLWLILLGVNILFLLGVWKQVLQGQPFGNRSMSDNALLFASGSIILFTLLFINFKLETQVKKDGIYVRFFPFHISFKYYPWNSISKSFVRKYSPLIEYGGWGLRSGLFGKGKAFNVSGDKGLQLEFLDHKKLLIGTNKPDELAAVLSRIGQLKV